GALPRHDVPADGDGEWRGAGPAADELPAPHPDLQGEDALIPRSADTHRRAWHDVPAREVGRTGGSLARAGDDTQRCAYLLHAGADAAGVRQGRAAHSGSLRGDGLRAVYVPALAA